MLEGTPGSGPTCGRGCVDDSTRAAPCCERNPYYFNVAHPNTTLASPPRRQNTQFEGVGVLMPTTLEEVGRPLFAMSFLGPFSA